MPRQLSKPQPFFSAQIFISSLLILPPHLQLATNESLAVLFHFRSFSPLAGNMGNGQGAEFQVFQYQSPGEFSWVTVFLSMRSKRSTGGRAEKQGERRELQSPGSPCAVGGVAEGDGTEVPISPPPGTSRQQQPPYELMEL